MPHFSSLVVYTDSKTLRTKRELHRRNNLLINNFFKLPQALLKLYLFLFLADLCGGYMKQCPRFILHKPIFNLHCFTGTLKLWPYLSQTQHFLEYLQCWSSGSSNSTKEHKELNTFLKNREWYKATKNEQQYLKRTLRKICFQLKRKEKKLNYHILFTHT